MHTEHRLLHREMPEIRSENPHDRIELTTHQALEGMQEKVQKEILEKAVKHSRERLQKIGTAATAERQKVIVDILSTPGLSDLGIAELIGNLLEQRLVSGSDFQPLMRSTIGLYSRRATIAMAIVIANDIEAAAQNPNNPFVPSMNTYTSSIIGMLRMRIVSREMLDSRIAALQNELIFDVIAEGLEAAPLSYDFYMQQLRDTAQILSRPQEDANETQEQVIWREQLQKVVAGAPKRFDAWMKKREEERKKQNERQ